MNFNNPCEISNWAICDLKDIDTLYGSVKCKWSSSQCYCIVFEQALIEHRIRFVILFRLIALEEHYVGNVIDSFYHMFLPLVFVGMKLLISRCKDTQNSQDDIFFNSKKKSIFAMRKTQTEADNDAMTEYRHKGPANRRWTKIPLAEKMLHNGSEMSRANSSPTALTNSYGITSKDIFSSYVGKKLYFCRLEKRNK